LTLGNPPREIEFVGFLSSLLRQTPTYSDVVQEAIIGREARFRADILAKRRSGNKIDLVLIECKTLPIPSPRIRDVVDQLRKYQALYGKASAVLVVPATLTGDNLEVLKYDPRCSGPAP
jgi:hypothetical protein